MATPSLTKTYNDKTKKHKFVVENMSNLALLGSKELEEGVTELTISDIDDYEMKGCKFTSKEENVTILIRIEKKERNRQDLAHRNQKITLLNNAFDILYIEDENDEDNKSEIVIGDGNQFNMLTCENAKVIYFSSRQKVNKDRDEAYLDHNKQTFMQLKDAAEGRGDWLQAYNTKREALICEALLKAQERKTRPLHRKPLMWGDYLIFLWGDISSSHGISWVRPLFCLAVLNVLFALIVYGSQIKVDSQFFLSFVALLCSEKFWSLVLAYFNPTFLLLEQYCSIVNESKGCVAPALLHLLDLIHRVLYLLLIYEMIRAGRRFTR